MAVDTLKMRSRTAEKTANGSTSKHAQNGNISRASKDFVDTEDNLIKTVASQALRSVLLSAYFWSSVASMAVTQYIGALLYFVNKDSFYAWMAFIKAGVAIMLITITQWWAPTSVTVSGDESVSEQIHQLPDGRIQLDFSDRMVLLSNHQIYSDWLYLWWAAYTNRRSMGGHVYIMLKDQIQYIPLVGLGLRLAGFIFMSRKMQTDQPRLAHRMKQLTQRGTQGLKPMWLLIFPEGTNLGVNGRAKSKQWADKQGIEDMKYQLIPRSTGTYFCLKALEGSLEWVYDCTVAYDGVSQGQYPQDMFTLRSVYFQGKPPAAHMYWRRFEVSKIPLSSLEEFDEWLNARWLEKDTLLGYHAKNQCFPSSLPDQKSVRTTVRLGGLWEVWKIFILLIVLGLGFISRSLFF